jgi:hypothetical protein
VPLRPLRFAAQVNVPAHKEGASGMRSPRVLMLIVAAEHPKTRSLF